MSEADPCEQLSSEQLYHLALRQAVESLDVRFLWELVQLLPAAEAAAGELDEAAADVFTLRAHIDDLTDAGRAPIADALRPLYLEYLHRRRATGGGDACDSTTRETAHEFLRRVA